MNQNNMNRARNNLAPRPNGGEKKPSAVTFTAGGQQITLTPETVKAYLVSGDPQNVTYQELAMFINLCKFNGLNPWLREAYLIKFGTSPATMVVGKEAYMKRAEAHQAYDGFEAGVLMSEKKPGFLILDLDLPGVNGFSLCEKIKTQKSFGKPVIAVVTALEDNDVEERVKNLGVNFFFKKPLNLLSIAEAVESVF